jgi:hypothetical protein
MWAGVGVRAVGKALQAARQGREVAVEDAAAVVTHEEHGRCYRGAWWCETSAHKGETNQAGARGCCARGVSPHGIKAHDMHGLGGHTHGAARVQGALTQALREQRKARLCARGCKGRRHSRAADSRLSGASGTHRSSLVRGLSPPPRWLLPQPHRRAAVIGFVKDAELAAALRAPAVGQWVSGGHWANGEGAGSQQVRSWGAGKACERMCDNVFVRMQKLSGSSTFYCCYASADVVHVGWRRMRVTRALARPPSP